RYGLPGTRRPLSGYQERTRLRPPRIHPAPLEGPPMNTDFLDYALPLELIAQQPCPERDQSRLLVTRRAGQSLEHRLFHDLPDLLSSGDLLVLNDTRVLPARLVGWRDRTGGRWEGLFLRQRPDGLWELVARRSYDAAAEGETILVEPGPLRLELVGRT